MSSILLPFIWLINGLLVLFFLLLDHIVTVLLVPVLAWLIYTASEDHRNWYAVTGVVSIIATFAAPAPLPTIILILYVLTAAAVRFERFNQRNLRWQANAMMLVHSAAAVGYTIYAAYSRSVPPQITGDMGAFLAQSGIFFNLVAFWVPLGYVALLIRSVLAHPPLPKTPTDMITTIRTRGRD
jgi:hypothetical protein